LELLRETVPNVSRVAVLWNPQNPANVAQWRATQGAAEMLGLSLLSLEAGAPDPLDAALTLAVREHADALITLDDPAVTSGERRRIVDLAASNRLPAMYHQRQVVDVGGLMAYGASLANSYRRAAYYVDRILKGAKPADLPVEQPMTFDFVINLKSAQALGLNIPRHVLLQATEIIQ
jgi:putative ABC transport system substrate-binding protein